jgi:hypothetical protein
MAGQTSALSAGVRPQPRGSPLNAPGMMLLFCTILCCGVSGYKLLLAYSSRWIVGDVCDAVQENTARRRWPDAMHA